ncbi:hypothetical protein JQU17_04200 [Ponticoccus sp. SC2-23]|uniref:hypothetical protein n=1 Tax=Alexandriicola marinus TaxID=2081710 RepID=UPI000FD81FDC|nr:hypothetical protein [Alexandriicola marinus]MBM1219387.1 hypothetical protein [Ponticoccus sp. SC6-9]MBM1223541.1 hypothetical protein [Ponticoccus sp. SC6-15]MBM1229200.1 hypothetical protein [Ponticoccus sp. SC6-38]MBM1232507.1 hypothetical protein [Ponticoccus sp. SC6-45]MBM1237543.1 hypothetical protein [Ponticoccus sp. SC6-49]MBM1241518.1 hypothetical protein [Ponticoccus sp. SC2-64]MBM1246031.1 hypothetical protein [Ponticoccus sp. SC6-42]MBM1250509.1 hypothetical protein [Pontico
MTLVSKKLRSATAIGLFAAAAPASQAIANDAGWDLLKSIGLEEIVTETSYEVRKSFPESLEAPVEGFSLTGFVVPLWNDGAIKDFILVSDMGFCPFCGDPEHGTAVQVELDIPMSELEEGMRITVQGVLEPVLDPETMQSVRLVQAAVVS